MYQCKYVKLIVFVLMLALLLPAGVYAQNFILRSMTIQDSDGIDVNRRTVYLGFNDFIDFEIVTEPDFWSSRTEIVVRSSNERVATVDYDEGGTSFTVNTYSTAGNVTITVQDKVSRKSAYVRLFVQDLVTSVRVYGEDTVVSAGNNLRLYAEVEPEDATNKRLIWTVYDQDCYEEDMTKCISRAASVSSNGVLSAKQVEEPTFVEVTACAVVGTPDACGSWGVEIKPVLNKLVILDSDSGEDVTSKVIYLNRPGEDGDSKNLTIQTDPRDMELDPDKVEILVSNDKIIDVYAFFPEISVASYNNSGSASITVRDKDSRKSATVRFSIQALSSSCEFDDPEASEVYSGGSVSVKASVNKEAANKNVEYWVYEADDYCSEFTLDGCTTPASSAIISRNGMLTARSVEVPTDVIVKACPADRGKNSEFCQVKKVTILPVMRDILVKYENDEGELVTITNADILSIVANDPIQLYLEAVPSSVCEDTEYPCKFSWRSSNPRVAEVTPDGLVIGHMKGSVTITVFSENNRVRNTIKVRVIGQLAESITINPGRIDCDLVDGKSVSLRAEVRPFNADVRTVKWTIQCLEPEKCTNGIPATVVNGKVTAMHVNLRTNIKVCAEPMDGSDIAPACVDITVAPKARGLRILDYETMVETIPGASSITIPIWGDVYHFHAPELTDMTAPIIKMLNTEQKTVQLVALLDFGGGEYEVATSKNVSWSSSNPRIADVDSTGLVTFYQAGTVSITARTTDGSNLSRTAVITAQYQIENITIFSANDTHVLGSGRSMQLYAQTSPYPSTNPRVRWYIHPVLSTSLQAAVVNEFTGVVTAAEVTREEHITVVAEAIDVEPRNQEPARGTFEIIIHPLVRSLEIICEDEVVNGTTVYVDYSQASLQVYAIAHPVNIAAWNVTWSSSNPRVATIDANSGLITFPEGNVQGSTVIRAVAKDGSNVSASFTLQVTAKAHSISIIPEPIGSRLEPCESIISGIPFYRLRAGTTVSIRADIPLAANKNAKWYVKNINNIPAINYRYNSNLGYSLGPSFTISGLNVSEKACALITAVPADETGSLEFGSIPDDLIDRVGICVFPTVKAVKIYKYTGYDPIVGASGKDLTGMTVYMFLNDSAAVGSEIFARNYPEDAYQHSGWVWASSNPLVLSYNETSKTFTARREGTAVLSARAIDGTNQTAQVRVNVVDPAKLSEEQRYALEEDDGLYLGRYYSRYPYPGMSNSELSADAGNGVSALNGADSGEFAISGPDTAAPGESVTLTLSGKDESRNVYWFSSDENVAGVDGSGTVTIAQNAAIDSVITIVAAMDDENTTFTTHEIKVAAAAEKSEATEEAAERTAEAIENGDLDALVQMLLAGDSEEQIVTEQPEAQSEIIETAEPVVGTETDFVEEPEQTVVTEIVEQPVETEIVEQAVETEIVEQPVEQTEEFVQETVETAAAENEQPILPEEPVTVSEEPVSDENQTESAGSVPAIEDIAVYVEDDLITVTFNETFTLESWKLLVLPMEADRSTLTFEVENEYVAVLESDEIAKISEEGLKIKGLGIGETKLFIKSGDVEKIIRIVVQPAPVDNTPEVIETVENTTEVFENGGDTMDVYSEEPVAYEETVETWEQPAVTEEPVQETVEVPESAEETAPEAEQPVEEQPAEEQIPVVEEPAEGSAEG